MEIAFFEIENWEKEYIEKSFQNFSLLFHEQILSKDNISSISDIEILSTFIYSKLSAEILSKIPNLKLIITRSTGHDHIDTDYCKTMGITVCNVPAYGVNTIAEHTFALILALSRKIIQSVEKTRKGNFNLENLRGFELAGKTLGIIGFGHIGKRVAEIAKTFKMNVLVTSKHHSNAFENVSLDKLLSLSDIVSIHTSLNPETKHLINQNNILLMKKGSFLINTARGQIVETEAIVMALEKGILSGVGLDVLEEEYALKEERELLTKEFLQKGNIKTQLLNHVLLKKENVIITPHNAFNSNEALKEILETTVLDIESFISGNTINSV